MVELKLLQLNYVELTGPYKNFPKLRWLCWHNFCLKTIPSGLLMNSLVALDMSYGTLEEFEPPMVLNLLKILNLKGSHKLVSIRNLHQIPNLETLILWNCYRLTNVCKNIGGLKRLALLDLTGCENLWNVILGKKHVNQPESVQALYIGEIPQRPLPRSLKSLFLNDCSIKYHNDVPVVFKGQPLFYMNLGFNLFEFLPNNITLEMLRVLDLTCCRHLKSLVCLPGTLQELYTYQCTSLEAITFQSARFRLQKFGYEGCFSLSEIQGLFKLVSIAKLDEADLGHMKWIKAYQDRIVELIGDEISKGRIWHIQMLYEYGIRSTYLPGIKDPIVVTSEYMSLSSCLSFSIPFCPNKRKIQGLNITFNYKASGEDEGMLVLFAKVSNITKGVTWMYNPVVYCKPGVNEEEVVWLSYWPIGGNILDTGDEVNVSIIVGNGLMVSGCGASIVYMDDELIEQENSGNNTREDEAIGGDLSEFELTKGVYYLCRRDFCKSTTPDWLQMLVGDAIHCTRKLLFEL